MTPAPGWEAFRCTVSEANTAVAVGSGEVPVLVPPVLALAERATVTTVVGALKAGTTTVRVRSSWTT